ncbi:MAG: FtsW/RodA/SpoVE family cell cycle protein, partial [Prevotellaceae bacterium]|nr:FtsW/RodA/SpoVE family cell cycle protein [Prevotellaceae bacterium]
MSKRQNILHSLDWTTIIIYVILASIGWLCVYSAVYDADHPSIFDMSRRYGMQLIWIASAFGLAIFVMCCDIKVFTVLSLPLYLLTVCLLIFVLFSGTEINGSKSWLSLGSIRIQPVEFMKVATALMVAHVMSEYGFKVTHPANILKMLVIFL